MSQQGQYGFPCVTDPHDFEPDAECSSPQEIEAHRRACATYGTDAYEPNKGCYSERDADGRLVKHVTRTSWGIGVNMIRMCDGECQEPCWTTFTTCHECGGHLDFCPDCWTVHERVVHGWEREP